MNVVPIDDFLNSYQSCTLVIIICNTDTHTHKLQTQLTYIDILYNTCIPHIDIHTMWQNRHGTADIAFTHTQIHHWFTHILKKEYWKNQVILFIMKGTQFWDLTLKHLFLHGFVEPCEKWQLDMAQSEISHCGLCNLYTAHIAKPSWHQHQAQMNKSLLGT